MWTEFLLLWQEKLTDETFAVSIVCIVMYCAGWKANPVEFVFAIQSESAHCLLTVPGTLTPTTEL